MLVSHSMLGSLVSSVHFYVVSCTNDENVNLLRSNLQLLVIREKHVGVILPSSYFTFDELLQGNAYSDMYTIINGPRTQRFFSNNFPEGIESDCGTQQS